MKRKATMAGVGLAAMMLAGVSVAGEQASYKVVDGGIPASLSGKAGDAQAGKLVMIDRKLGNCLACHVVSELKDQPFQGEVGPPLDGAGDRWTEAQLRLIVASSKEIFPGTIMPAFHQTGGLNRVADKFEGETILTATQVEDVVAFLKTLEE
jgi:sulfur-oxidizing protein SoxX